ncbi:MAG: hypothetical protein V4557_12555 [Bacteroidota bacterium]
MPKHGEPSTHFSLLLIGPDGQPGPTMGNYDTLQEAVDNWVEMYTEDGPDIAIVRVFSTYDSKLKIHEVTSMEVVPEEEVESVQVNELSDTSVDDLLTEMNENNDFVADEHPDWTIKEFYAIVNYTAALDDESIGLEVPPVSTHDTLEEAKTAFAEKKYSSDYSIVIRQLKVNPSNPKEYYLFDEWDVE